MAFEIIIENDGEYTIEQNGVPVIAAKVEEMFPPPQYDPPHGTILVPRVGGGPSRIRNVPVRNR